eukprot:scaffold75408_cov31-Tisochrysis_lutea.AAC.4
MATPLDAPRAVSPRKYFSAEVATMARNFVRTGRWRQVDRMLTAPSLVPARRRAPKASVPLRLRRPAPPVEQLPVQRYMLRSSPPMSRARAAASRKTAADPAPTVALRPPPPAPPPPTFLVESLLEAFNAPPQRLAPRRASSSPAFRRSPPPRSRSPVCKMPLQDTGNPSASPSGIRLSGARSPLMHHLSSSSPPTVTTHNGDAHATLRRPPRSSSPTGLARMSTDSARQRGGFEQFPNERYSKAGVYSLHGAPSPAGSAHGRRPKTPVTPIASGISGSGARRVPPSPVPRFAVNFGGPGAALRSATTPSRRPIA